jgi:xanthine dehydrogenase accessory factor
MRELGQILELWKKTEAAGEDAVLATVVKTRGSSYRMPGARLLLTRTLGRAGSVSGGCLEDDLIKRAWWFTEKGPALRRYDTTPEGEIGYGLGCNGIIHVLLERLQSSRPTILDLVARTRTQRRPSGIAHLLRPQERVGQRLTIDGDGTVRHNLSDDSVCRIVEDETRAALAEGGSRALEIGSAEVFIETIAPAVRLLVFGAGDDAVPLTEMAAYLGWSVFVFDGRAHYARKEKFPAAERVAVRQSGDAIAAVDPWTVAVLMSHSYSQDLEALRELAACTPRYLGILGPRKRSLQLLADAGLEPDQLGAALHTPIGLDIGADGPEQVALSVIAEIQAWLNRRDGGQLRERRGSIHSRDEEDESSPFAVHSIVCA